MRVFDSILSAVGRTPLVKLQKVVPPGCATVLAKCEYMNPTGSIKDRMAVHVLNESERQGLIKPGATIVENTSGNTGQGVAMWAAVKGYRCVFTMPDKMSMEKVNMLKAFGAALPGLFVVVIILGGILSGAFTATESASIAVAFRARRT